MQKGHYCNLCKQKKNSVTILVGLKCRVKQKILKIKEKAKIVAENALQFQATLYATFSPENSL
jgi:hypothetical protein